MSCIVRRLSWYTTGHNKHARVLVHDGTSSQSIDADTTSVTIICPSRFIIQATNYQTGVSQLWLVIGPLRFKFGLWSTLNAFFDRHVPACRINSHGRGRGWWRGRSRLVKTLIQCLQCNCPSSLGVVHPVDRRQPTFGTESGILGAALHLICGKGCTDTNAD